VKEKFFRRHVAALYDEATDHGARFLRVGELLMAVASRYPALLPNREQIDAERALMQQSAKRGYELEQGLFVAQVLADERCGLHLIHAMLKPKGDALERIGEFRKTGIIDLGEAKVERKGKIGHVTLLNSKFLNAEDDRATAALETAIDLTLLDDAIEVGVLRGGTVQHPKYQGRRIFNAGINLTHLYYGQISYVHFFVERELGLMHKIYRGHWRSESRSCGSRRSKRSRSAAVVNCCASWIVCSPKTAHISICRLARKASSPGPRTCDSRGWSAASSRVKGSSSSACSTLIRRKAARFAMKSFPRAAWTRRSRPTLRSSCAPA
jgi:thioesterase DpgC